MTLTRATLGRLAAHARDAQAVADVTTAFDAGHWEGFSGTGTATPTVSADATPGELIVTLNAGSGQRGARYTNVEPGEDCFVVAERRSQTTGGAPGVVARQKSATPALDLVACNGAMGFSGNWNLYEYLAGAVVQQDTFATNRSTTTLSRHAAWIRGALANGYQECASGTSGDATATHALTGLDDDSDGTFAGIYFGSSAANASRWQSFALMRSAILRVEGPATGSWVVRLRDASGTLIHTSSAHTAGVVEINTLTLLETLYGGAVPIMARIEIYDTGTEEVISGPEAPSERLWGGDVWEWSEPIAPDAPGAPDFDAIGGTDVLMSWEPVAGATSYRVERAPSEFGSYTEVGSPTDPEFQDTDLEPLTTYWYRLRACNEVGCSDPGPAASATTLAVVPAIPGAPTVTGTGETTTLVAWDPVEHATGYDVHRSLTSVGGYTLVGSVADPSFGDSGLEPATTYYYRVSACSSAGCSDLGPFGAGSTLTPIDYRNCALVLEVFDDAGAEVVWSVSTDSAHPFPFLRFTSNYGSREIDPVAGAATIGTVDVTIADVPTVPGDQRTGFVTARLGTIYGRRARLRRFVSDAVGFVVIADGPAGPPRLDESYAGYAFSIRDVRETERRLRPFSSGGTAAIVPQGSVIEWGDRGDGSRLVEAVTPVTGRMFVAFNVTAGEWFGLVLFTESWDYTDFDNPRFPPEFTMSPAGQDAQSPISLGVRSIFPQADILWRPAGSSGAFNVARPSVPTPYAQRLANFNSGINDATDVAGAGLVSATLFAAPTVPAGFPADGDEVEVIVRHRGTASPEHPYYYEGTVGDMLTALYLRDLERAPATGGTLYDPEGLDDSDASEFGGGVRFDASALAAITTPIMLRQVEGVDDGRDWAERAIYGPSGWIPALDAVGQISPVARDRPNVIPGPMIDAEVAEPSPEWDAGERVVTSVSFTHNRYFRPGPLSGVAVGLDGLAVREVVTTFRDPAAEARHGDQGVEYDARAFGAIGTDGESVFPGGASREGFPEQGAVLAAAANYEVLQRYRDGAPAFRLAVRRAAVPGIREGLYCPAELSWLPEIGATLRGLDVEAVQVLALENADCEWVTLLLEVTPVVAAPGYAFDGEKTGDDPVPGFATDPEITGDELSEG